MTDRRIPWPPSPSRNSAVGGGGGFGRGSGRLAAAAAVVETVVTLDPPDSNGISKTNVVATPLPPSAVNGAAPRPLRPASILLQVAAKQRGARKAVSIEEESGKYRLCRTDWRLRNIRRAIFYFSPTQLNIARVIHCVSQPPLASGGERFMPDFETICMQYTLYRYKYNKWSTESDDRLHSDDD